MTIIELLDRLIAGEAVTPEQAKAVRDDLGKDQFGSIDQAGDRLRAAVKRLKD